MVLNITTFLSLGVEPKIKDIRAKAAQKKNSYSLRLQCQETAIAHTSSDLVKQQYTAKNLNVWNPSVWKSNKIGTR